MSNVYLPYRTIFFLTFFLLPLGALIILFVIRYLFYDKRNHHPDSKIHGFFDVVKGLVICGVVLTLTALSTWQYIHVSIVIIPSFFFLLVMSLLHLKSRYYDPSPSSPGFDPIVLQSIMDHSNRDNETTTTTRISEIEEDDNHETIKFDEFVKLDSTSFTKLKQHDEDEVDDDLEETSNSNFDSSYDEAKKTRRFKSYIMLKSSKRSLITFDWWKQFSYDCKQVIQSSPRILVILIGIMVPVIGIVMPLMMDRMCICSHPMTLSTRMTRIGSPSCEKNQICISYLSLPEDPSHSIIFYYHTRDTPDQAYIKYQPGKINGNTTSASLLSQSINAQSKISMSSTIKEENRWVISCYLDQLLPDTLYSFAMCYTTINDDNTICSPIYRFKTLPNDDSPITFVQGGDIQLNKEAIDMAQQSSNMNPRFVIIGGDIAYAEGIPACYQRWDEKLKFLTSYYSNVTDDQIMIPFLMTIGNHEAGGFFQTTKQVPFYLHYFAFSQQHVTTPPRQRPTYHHHLLGNYASVTALDSCIVSSWADQKDWLKSKYETQPSTHQNRLVVYHVPIYPGYDGNKDIYELGRSDIVPIFEQYNVSIVMENHEHIFKRSYALENGKVVPGQDDNSSGKEQQNNTNTNNGIIYIGGGAFGIGEMTKNMETSNLPWDIKKRSTSNHLWMITITPTNVTSIAINSSGKAIDQFTKSINVQPQPTNTPSPT